MNEIKELVSISKYAGGRFDLVQASGGNASVKRSDGVMLIKASGFLLSEVELHKGYTCVNNKKIVANLENPAHVPQRKPFAYYLQGIKKGIPGRVLRPSIEVFLHSFLEKYTLHTHPIAVNAITCRKQWKGILQRLFKEAVYVDYKTPGVGLALEIKRHIEHFAACHGRKPKVIFLQNHGLIVTTNNFKEVEDLTESVLKKIEGYLGVSLDKYKVVTRIASLYARAGFPYQVAYCSDDKKIVQLLLRKKDLFNAAPYSPDTVVFCGPAVFRLSNTNNAKALSFFIRAHGIPPKVVFHRDNVFFVADDIRKTRAIEEVFKAHLFSLSLAKKTVRFLNTKEIQYLCAWEEELYRQRL